jgi:cytochrome P450
MSYDTMIKRSVSPSHVKTTKLKKFRQTGMTKEEINATFAILLVAGSETTASLLSALTFFLCKYPEVLSRLTSEIRTAFKSEDEITIVSVNSLKYELAVIEEAFRMLPPAPNGGPRVVPPEGAIINGQWVSGGTTVVVPWYSAHRQKSNWRDPDSFVPERWLGDERYKADNKGAFAPFSVGPRNCIGVK